AHTCQSEHKHVGASTSVAEQVCHSERIGDTVPCPVTKPFGSASPPSELGTSKKRAGGGRGAAQPGCPCEICLSCGNSEEFFLCFRGLFWERAGLCPGLPRKTSGNPQRRGAAADSPGGFFSRAGAPQPSFARKGFAFCHLHGTVTVLRIWPPAGDSCCELPARPTPPRIPSALFAHFFFLAGRWWWGGVGTDGSCPPHAPSRALPAAKEKLRSSALLPGFRHGDASPWGRLHASFEVFIEPPVLVVEHGGAVRLKCRTTCQDPSATGDVETSFFKHRLEASGQGETVVELRNITEWSSNILCFYSCNKQRKTVSATLIAYRPLEQAVLEPVPQLAVGESHELVCRVPRVAPVRNLTVILRRGATTLHTATFELRAENKPQDVEVLDVYDFPEDPRLEMSEIYLETDEKINVSCRVRQAFPAARFELSLAGHPLPLHVTEDGLRAVAEVSHAQQGKFGLVCSVRVGPKERQKQASVHVYSFPQPQLNVSTSVPMEGTEVTGRCVLPPGHSPDLQLQVTAGPRVLAAWGPSPLVFAWTASEEDDDTKLVCEARMRAGNKPTKRSTPVGLSVTALPRMDDRSCPPSQNWTEGEEVTLRCQARGNPRPHVACDKDGTSITPGLRHVATRAHTGTFRCRASNALGMAERSITVWVQYHDVDVVLIVVLVLVALGALVIAGVVYGIYYRKKKMREYQLQKQQRRMEMERLRSEETVGINGSAPGSQP
uniref:Ig-like domain-containing protein n=1 Tax=Anser cygnoides TaxID=8845 RepID=A0A8B9DQR3_ANSCY